MSESRTNSSKTDTVVATADDGNAYLAELLLARTLLTLLAEGPFAVEDYYLQLRTSSTAFDAFVALVSEDTDASITNQRATDIVLGHCAELRPPSTPAPENSWAGRGTDDARSPLQFLNDVWGDYLSAGRLHQDTLSRLDPSLLKALKNWCGRHGHRLRDHLPPKQRRLDREISDQEGRELARLARAAYRRNVKN